MTNVDQLPSAPRNAKRSNRFEQPTYKGANPRATGLTNSSSNSKLHGCEMAWATAVHAPQYGRMSVHKSVALILNVLPTAMGMLGERHDVNWFRDALAQRGIAATSRRIQLQTSPAIAALSLVHKIDNLFANLKDWQHIYIVTIAAATPSFSAICIAAFTIFWINQ